MSILTSLKQYFKYGQRLPEDPLLQELFFLQRSIRKTRGEIRKMEDNCDNMVCCYSCALGGAYSNLQDRLDRQEAQEKKLIHALTKRKYEKVFGQDEAMDQRRA